MNAVATPERSLNGKFANDGSLESVEAMLIKQAASYYSTRVLPQGLPMEFDDVLQVLKMAYVKARAKWSPEKARFNTYCYTVARNEFNRYVERMAADRAKMGMESIDDLAPSSEDGGGPRDGYERFAAEDAEESGPEAVRARREAMRERLAALSPITRKLIAALLQNEMDRNAKPLTLRELAVHMGLAGPSLVQVQREIAIKLGVSIPFGTRRKILLT